MIPPDIIVWHLLSRKVDALDEIHLLKLKKESLDEQQYAQEEERLQNTVKALDNHIRNVCNLARFIGSDKRSFYLKL